VRQMAIGVVLGLALASPALAQDWMAPNATPKTELLWPGAVPGAVGTEDADKPTLTVYLPSKGQATGTGIVICPGGGYRNLAMDHEGFEVARWLTSRGIAGFVLKYRLGPRYHHPAMLQDVLRAIRVVRSRAEEFNIKSDRVGVMGFSAGGHLASSAATLFDAPEAKVADGLDAVSSRPDFAVLGYPVISFVEPWTHQGSKTNLLGENPDPALARSLSSETQVTATTPPTFIYHTTTDATVPVENAVAYYLALRKAGVSGELHVFRNGPHGTGLGQTDLALAEWPRLLANWLRVSGFLK